MNNKFFVALAVLSVAGLAHARVLDEKVTVVAVEPAVEPVVTPVRDLFNKPAVEPVSPVVVKMSQREAEMAKLEQEMKAKMADEAAIKEMVALKAAVKDKLSRVETKPYSPSSKILEGAVNERVSHFIEMLNKFGNDRELVKEFLARYKEMVPEAKRTFESNMKNAFRDRDSLVTFLRNVRAILNKIVEE